MKSQIGNPPSLQRIRERDIQVRAGNSNFWRCSKFGRLTIINTQYTHKDEASLISRITDNITNMNGEPLQQQEPLQEAQHGPGFVGIKFCQEW